MFCKNSDLTKKQKLEKLIVLIKNSKTLGLSYQSDIGLDDIMVRPGPCPALQPVDATMPPVTTATTRPIASTKATTRTVATTMDPMVTREYNPFFTPKIESCTISTSFGEKTEQYISNMFICCGNKITSRLNGSKCCDGVQYFARKQDCCDGEVIDKENFTCCGGKKTPVEPGKICCNGEIRAKEASLSCCADKEFFDKTSQGCCIDKLYSKGSSFCCGGSVLEKDDEKQKCCGSGWKGEKYSPGRLSCCNGNLFAIATYDCCGDTYVYSKLYEECHVTPAGDENEKEHVSVTLKEKQKWRKPSQRAGQFLFNYRKRRDAQSTV
ncbi:unnamed protein product [Oikopleura dioica]|uniref:Galaxin-like repeats domain-containing protein n=1 Tax=Oikopleura dioica TaxID=34765 RepID=E4XPD0_OIKDI|nr:unnamed protein product [Oikopleura dioica]